VNAEPFRSLALPRSSSPGQIQDLDLHSDDRTLDLYGYDLGFVTGRRFVDGGARPRPFRIAFVEYAENDPMRDARLP
jgi:hypothetical protein